MSNLPTNPQDPMASLFAAMGGVSYEEMAAQAEASQESMESRYVRPDAGKVTVRYAKTGKFEIPDPKTMDKPEDERVVMTPKKIKGVIMNSSVWLQNWPMGSKGPACKSVSHKSQGLDPATRARAVVEGNPALPTKNKWDFISRYEPSASRREKVTDVDGNESISRAKTSCVSCQALSEDAGTDDGFFKGCGFRGSLDFVLTHIGDSEQPPMLCYIEMSATSVAAYSQLTSVLASKYEVRVPAELHVELQIEAQEAKDGSPYYKLKFVPIGISKSLGDEFVAVVSGLYAARNAVVAGGNAEAPKAIEAAKTETKGKASKPSPF